MNTEYARVKLSHLLLILQFCHRYMQANETRNDAIMTIYPEEYESIRHVRYLHVG